MGTGITSSTGTGTDPAGLETLELFAHAPLFNRWLFETIRPYCSGRLLEIGSGIGNISVSLLKLGIPVTLSDLREEYCDILRSRFGGMATLDDVCRADLAAPDFEERYPRLLDHFDSVVALNVVEHIREDSLAIANCKKMLRPGGRLIVLVPAYQFLFNNLDRELGHFRRYDKKSLRQLLEAGGLAVNHTQYFNFAGITGWCLTGSVLKRRTIPGFQLRLYNKLVPVFRMADAVTGHSAGLSVIAIAKN
ncbi:MAG: class I SAM-dependent methyltransferase [Puia sp.]|nr:class I SAM-dependent methyltransferase [Puia sp.]